LTFGAPGSSWVFEGADQFFWLSGIFRGNQL
jgi:hypothetical protein